jgi:hypothetical protein
MNELTTPEACRMLLLSVLARAVEDLSNSPMTSAHQSAYEWLFLDRSRDAMSAYWVCQSLGMHVDSLRRRIREHAVQKRRVMRCA